MIPKIIHYCWLSDEPIPANLQTYIDGWKKLMPEYKFKKWDKKAFDIHSVRWVEDAYNNHKWAFAADYIRAYALYTEGGFYLDSDVYLQGKLDNFLNAGFVSSIEYNPSCKEKIKDCINKDKTRKITSDFVDGLGIQAAIIGSEKGNGFVKELLDYYNNNSFIKEDGSLNQLPAPIIYSLLLESKGFKYTDKNQYLNENIIIYKSSIFASYQTCKFNSTCIHMCEGSWVNNKCKNNFFKRIKKNLFMRKLYNSFFLTNV